MLKPLLKPVLGVVLMLCSAQASAGDGNEGQLGFIGGGGHGGPGFGGGNGSNYYLVYLGSYYDTPRFAGPLTWRFSAMALSYGGNWYQPGFPGQEFHASDWRVMTGPSLGVVFPNGWWLWDGFQAGPDREDTGPGLPLLMLHDELMFGLGFFSSYWNVDVRLTPDAGFQLSYLLWQLSFRMAPWFAFGPELRRQTSATSLGFMVRVGENQGERHWSVTAGSTFDDKVGGQWHLDLWYAP